MAIAWGYRKRERFADSKGRTCGAVGLVSKRDCKGDYSLVYNIDHIVPESKGGPDEVNNLRILCMPCNSLKGDLEEEEFLLRAKMRREIIAMQTAISQECGIDMRELSAVFKSVSIPRQFDVLSKITPKIVSMPEADYRKYA
ncbi:HNH endonuclease [Fontibacillus phaseoli]|uniref:HNH endonuclease n=1 Tax=Fontibacillus phaseoli TaxID=1416533 RepID=A0A369BMQ8_9BACL|nr:HNH endonuclease signature motif containing protein [Fontibacillus phaseoli]RCX22882.1 HNH endonuclease [Fontibacillus phaseoli]